MRRVRPSTRWRRMRPAEQPPDDRRARCGTSLHADVGMTRLMPTMTACRPIGEPLVALGAQATRVGVTTFDNDPLRLDSVEDSRMPARPCPTYRARRARCALSRRNGGLGSWPCRAPLVTKSRSSTGLASASSEAPAAAMKRSDALACRLKRNQEVAPLYRPMRNPPVDSRGPAAGARPNRSTPREDFPAGRRPGIPTPGRAWFATRRYRSSSEPVASIDGFPAGKTRRC
jgi:hypothetical protein